MATIKQWWVLQHPSEAAPAVLFGVDSDGLPRRYVPGEGMVDWPSLAEYTVGGEPGARPVSRDEALHHVVRNLGRVDRDVVDRNRGDAPTIRI